MVTGIDIAATEGGNTGPEVWRPHSCHSGLSALYQRMAPRVPVDLHQAIHRAPPCNTPHLLLANNAVLLGQHHLPAMDSVRAPQRAVQAGLVVTVVTQHGYSCDDVREPTDNVSGEQSRRCVCGKVSVRRRRHCGSVLVATTSIDRTCVASVLMGSLCVRRRCHCPHRRSLGASGRCLADFP